MKTGFYARLAYGGIRKNSRLYTPYLLTCTGMVMMLYVISALSSSPVIRAVRGGRTVAEVMNLGVFVICVFSAIFLFYTNSFLMGRRRREFGLYNILGMGKRNIGRILLWESLMTAGLSLVVGLSAGIGLFKLAELWLVNIIRGKVSYPLSISLDSVKMTVICFSVIFLLIYLNDLRQIHASNPVQLLKGGSLGEKPPRANWLLGAAGLVLLGAAYYVAVSITNPLAALLWFFAAVIAVIIASYILFVAGSVIICRLLQKNKKYYYKANHFVSVSSMAFRMKRNGAGLASICILATMVLVIISSTTCLYFGLEDSLRSRYPRDFCIDMRFNRVEEMGDGEISAMREVVDRVSEEKSVNPENVLEYRSGIISGMLKDGRLNTDVSSVSEMDLLTYKNLYQVLFLPLEDYNRLSGSSETLEEGEVLVGALRSDYSGDTFAVDDGPVYRVKKVSTQFVENSDAAMNITDSLMVVLPDFEGTIRAMQERDASMSTLRWYYCFDTQLNQEEQLAACEAYENALLDSISELTTMRGFRVDCAASERSDVYALYGGLFFLGIMLSIVFIFAAVLIIYYKQISEGYEDQARFAIMQKVGMTKKDIRRSVNSQLLTVFFLPLLGAGMHLTFAFPMVRKLLMLLNLNNFTLLAMTTLLSFAAFAVLYTIVYRITSNAYFSIVSGARDARA